LPELTREELIEIVREHRPTNIASLKKFLKEKNILVSDEQLLALIGRLQSDGAINLSIMRAGSFNDYLADIWNAWWFYLVIMIALSEFFLVLSDAQGGVALSLRILFGLGMLGLIPGFLTILIVFPGDQIKTLEKVALGIFLSVMISIAVGVMLGLGTLFQASNSIIILTVYVVLADVAASYRAYEFLRKSSWIVLRKT
jgi:Protein of unknown function (DUF1616)